MHPTRGAILLMSTDLTLCALDIIRFYGLRFKIEHMFRQAEDILPGLSEKYAISGTMFIPILPL